MSNLVRGSNSSLSNYTARERVGKGMVVTGGTGLALMGVAWLLPFVTLPMLLVMLVLAGVFL